MALRVGTDLVCVDAVRNAIRAHRDRYLRRIYTEAELADCTSATGVDPARLAARFAAKEAAIKVLRPADDQAVPWRTVAVRRTRSGAPALELRGVAGALASDAGIGELAVSLTHENAYAVAVVVAEIEPREL